MLNLIKRNTPELAESFVIEEISRSDGHDVYEIDSADGKVVLRGSGKVALAAAYYRYLREFCDINLSWCGNREIYAIDELPLPTKKISCVIKQDKRMALSYDIYSNDACWWDWRRWEHELDFMAMNGVNMALSIVGYEGVWYYSMLSFNINREDAIGSLSGPTYFPLQLTGKLDSYLSLIDTDYLKHRIDLGKKIVARMRELEITPVLQGFTGHVPKSFRGYFRKADISPVNPWRTFPNTYRISPSDPLFVQVGTALAKKQEEFFGKTDYYMSCPFGGVSPMTKNPFYMKSFGKAIASVIEDSGSDAVWVIDSESYSKSLVGDVPKDKVLVIDTDGTGCDAFNGFDGYSFISGVSFNHGGHTSLHGNIHALADNPFAQTSKKYINAVGAGVFPESTVGNPMYAELALTMMTHDGKIDLEKWLDGYGVRRWGSDERCLKKAAKKLSETCYSEKSTGSETGSIIAARPSTEIAHTAPFDTLELRYDNKELCDALELMLSSKGDYSEGYVFDICDVLRQIMSNYARELYFSVIKGYQNRDARLFEMTTNAFIRLLEDMDSLLNSVPEFRLENYLSLASSSAVGKLERQNFELNVLCQVTMFGPFHKPEYYDACWKEWTDMVGGYYAKRWHAFFELLAKGFNKKRTISTVEKKQLNGRNLSRSNKFYKALDASERKWITNCKTAKPSDEDALALAETLFEKYKKAVRGENIN